jgi:hypothetical protein
MNGHSMIAKAYISTSSSDIMQIGDQVSLMIEKAKTSKNPIAL